MSLLELTAVELAKEIKAGKTTAVEAMKAVLEQIEKTEETYHCYITIDKEKAMQAAKEAQEKIAILFFLPIRQIAFPVPRFSLLWKLLCKIAAKMSMFTSSAEKLYTARLLS